MYTEKENRNTHNMHVRIKSDGMNQATKIKTRPLSELLTKLLTAVTEKHQTYSATTNARSSVKYGF